MAIRRKSLINEGLTSPFGSIRFPREGVPAGGVGDHAVGMNDLSTGQLHPNGLTLLDQDLADLGFVPDGTTMALVMSSYGGMEPPPSLGDVMKCTILRS